MAKKGWHKESRRHSLASRGIKTNTKIQTPINPPIRKNSLEYNVSLENNYIIKRPNPGFEFKVKSDAMKFNELGDLAPETIYDEEHNILIQEPITGRFATEQEVLLASELARAKGWRATGLLPHDVIITPQEQIKIIDVGHFERL